MLTSQPWRAVTALTLHADGTHVLGNAISGTVFASAVHRRLGAGGSALAILASGILGNLGNALWHRSIGDPGHGSIGASTAVFGAIGLLAATQVVVNFGVRSEDRKAKASRSWTDIAGPLVGGFALLRALGAGGPTTDLGRTSSASSRAWPSALSPRDRSAATASRSRPARARSATPWP